MQFYITDMGSVPHIQRNVGITQTLSILDYDPFPFYMKDYKGKSTFIKVSDYEQPLNERCPSPITVEKIVRFAEQLEPEDNVLIHCHAGISRSTAAAMIVIYYHTHDLQKVKEAIAAMRPQAAPNRLICELADSYFKHDEPFLFDIGNEFCQNRFKGQDIVNNKL